MPTFEKPNALDSISYDTEKNIYMEDTKAYAKYNRVLTRSAKKLYLIVLVHCTKILCAKMKGRGNRKSMYDKSKSVELLKMIKEITFKVDTGKNIYMTTWKVKQETSNHFRTMTPQRDT